MKKNRVIQFSLIIAAIVLFIYTYHSSSNKNDIVSKEEKDLSSETSRLTEEISNVIDNVSYNGTDNRGTFFELNAKSAEVFHDKPNISNMKIVDAIISLRDGSKIYIKSDFCVYDRSTNDANFVGNVLITESNNKITSDNLDLNMSKNLITVYNNVKYNGKKGFLIADKVDIDILKNESDIFMFNKKDKVQVKYKN